MAALIEDISTPYEFSALETELECLASREARETLLQWNVDATLRVQRFKFTGAFSASVASDYDRLLRDFFRDAAAMAHLEVSGSPSSGVVVESQAVGTSVMSMEFFDRLESFDITSSTGGGGQIRGCFEEYFDGIQCGDKLREVLLNPDSENASCFSESEKLELIYILFRLLVVGGSLCQPDDRLERYQTLTKGFYRDLLTVYKDDADNIQVSGKVFKVNAVPGLCFYAHPDKELVNRFIVYVDPKKKSLVVVKNDYKPFW